MKRGTGSIFFPLWTRSIVVNELHVAEDPWTFMAVNGKSEFPDAYLLLALGHKCVSPTRSEGFFLRGAIPTWCKFRYLFRQHTV